MVQTQTGSGTSNHEPEQTEWRGERLTLYLRCKFKLFQTVALWVESLWLQAYHLLLKWFVFWSYMLVKWAVGWCQQMRKLQNAKTTSAVIFFEIKFIIVQFQLIHKARVGRMLMSMFLYSVTWIQLARSYARPSICIGLMHELLLVFYLIHK